MGTFRISIEQDKKELVTLNTMFNKIKKSYHNPNVVKPRHDDIDFKEVRAHSS